MRRRRSRWVGADGMPAASPAPWQKNMRRRERARPRIELPQSTRGRVPRVHELALAALALFFVQTLETVEGEVDLPADLEAPGIAGPGEPEGDGPDGAHVRGHVLAPHAVPPASPPPRAGRPRSAGSPRCRRAWSPRRTRPPLLPQARAARAPAGRSRRPPIRRRRSRARAWAPRGPPRQTLRAGRRRRAGWENRERRARGARTPGRGARRGGGRTPHPRPPAHPARGRDGRDGRPSRGARRLGGPPRERGGGGLGPSRISRHPALRAHAGARSGPPARGAPGSPAR